MSGYTVIDLETTGLFPHQHDRVVEIGVVYVSDAGEIQDEWSTLVNPHRDVGPKDLHGVTARDVMDAPTFAELAPYILRAITGRTVVAHNVRFDLRFLEYELQRAGLTLTELPLLGICTMQWAGRYLPAASRKLIDCCDAAGITLANQHDALCDAHGAAELLIHLLRTVGPPPPWSAELGPCRSYPWPSWSGAIREVHMLPRSNPAPTRTGGWLDRIVAGMPHWDDVRIESYLEVLESALLDRYLSAHEEQALVDTAVGLGLERTKLVEIHREYLASMGAVALADGVVTADERADLEKVASLLGLAAKDVDAALVAGTPRRQSHEFTLQAGDWICLTGSMQRARSDWEALATAKGLKVGGLTKRTRVLVAADPDSQSGKAAKARAYGIPIVNEAMLDRLLNLADDRSSGDLSRFAR